MSADDPDHDELARRANAELAETEDLLAGFDRPGRTPRTPATTRDFVDYHLEKGRPSREPRAPSSRPPPQIDRSREFPTAIIPTTKSRVRTWLPWIVLLIAMPIGGLLVAALVTTPSPADRPAPSASASAIPQTPSATIPAERDIPAPPAPATTEPVQASPPIERHAPLPAAPASASVPPPSSAAPKPSAREEVDLIRNL
jgi:hypothetical protein